MNPGISERMHAGWCIVTVHLIGGSDSGPFSYVLTREKAIRQAYARMAGVPNEWDESTVEIAGKPVHQMVMKRLPRVKLLEMRLPGGRVRGGRVPLALLWDESATIASYPMNADGSGGARYDRAALIATLGAILKDATEIFTLNPDTVPFIEHPDHIYSARITRNVAQTLGLAVPIRYHLTYPMGGLPMNVPAAEVQLKRDEVASYFTIDGNEGTHVFGEYQWNGNWVARRYSFAGQTNRPEPDFVPRTLNLVNAYTSQCLTSAGAGKPPSLAACTGTPAQDWRWQPVTGYPGNPHDAALVSEASWLCVAERGRGLLEETCDASDIAQRWTPWDFGLVYTPWRRCLGEKDGVLALGACAPLTTEYRWAPTPHSQWTDLRLEGAMYADVRGNGKPGAVFVERRRDGPGFDVWATDLAPGAHAERWYANAVPFDYTSIQPTCQGDTLCFDSTRFLLADFEGTGRADLMAIAPRGGGTAFWLMRSTGSGFEKPRLWYQSALSPALAQQYAAADFSGHGRADVMAAQRRAHADGLDLWVLASNGATGSDPALWMAAPGLADGTQFLAAHIAGSAGSARTGLLALERSSEAGLSITQLASSGSAFNEAGSKQRFTGFPATLAKAASGDVDGDGVDDLIVLSARNPNAQNRANIDVWMMKGGARFADPERIATLNGVSWADEIPALVQPSGNAWQRQGPTLVLFERANAVIGDTYFTGGAPGLAGYPLSRDAKLGPMEDWGSLPGLFTETLRLDRQRQ
ncbi:ricin-type beta-trefoil lectin domain protein [Trinickia terrae]|uniref:ricin-type beta-trefoil lectin domain protein n=1 Tax=Trinickia terrae TaxID=2571161 RepID=UPI001F1027C4|nr:ricin-type beta-trefoil lectin domain protein [Trinickia terrae]